MKKLVIEIFQITNGYLMENHSSGEIIFLGENWEDVHPVFKESVNEARLLNLIKNGNYPGKIAAIRAVRDYCSRNNWDKYYGLKDAKDYVEKHFDFDSRNWTLPGVPRVTSDEVPF